MSLSDKVTDGKLIVIDGMNLESAKTKQFIEIMKSFEIKLSILGKKQLLVMPKKDDSLVRASRNIPHLTSTLATSLNITDILKADSMVILKDSLAVIEKTYLKEGMKAPKADKPASKKEVAKAEAKATKAPAKAPIKELVK